MNKEKLASDIQDLWTNLIQVRAAFPYARFEHIGKTEIESPSYYKFKGQKLKIQFQKALTEPDIVRLRGLSYWLNQSFLIRLYALLEYHGVISNKIKINTKLNGHEELEILRRLRTYIAHADTYNPNDPKQFKLFNRIVSHFQLVGHDTHVFPIPIDKVVERIFLMVKKYISEI